MITITRVLPGGEGKTFTCTKIRDVGKHVAYVIHDNTNTNKNDAARLGMDAESAAKRAKATKASQTLAAHGYVFTISS